MFFLGSSLVVCHGMTELAEIRDSHIVVHAFILQFQIQLCLQLNLLCHAATINFVWICKLCTSAKTWQFNSVPYSIIKFELVWTVIASRNGDGRRPNIIECIIYNAWSKYFSGTPSVRLRGAIWEIFGMQSVEIEEFEMIEDCVTAEYKCYTFDDKLRLKINILIYNLFENINIMLYYITSEVLFTPLKKKN